MAKGIVRLVERAQRNINNQIAQGRDAGSLYSRGLSREGYAGGYCDALSDVLLALNGVVPNRNGWWREDAEGGNPEGRTG